MLAFSFQASGLLSHCAAIRHPAIPCNPQPAASFKGESVMKKLLLIAATTLVSLAAIQPAFAYDHHNCHKVKVHHHWETRCHH
jgi:hypothetical protein